MFRVGFSSGFCLNSAYDFPLLRFGAEPNGFPPFSVGLTGVLLVLVDPVAEVGVTAGIVPVDSLLFTGVSYSFSRV